MEPTTTKNSIHPTAIVSEKAELGSGVEVGPYAVIGPRVRIGNGTRIAAHAVIEGRTQIGRRCQIFVGACLGMPAQTRHSEHTVASLIIGDDNIIREYVTVNSSMKEGGKTVIGDRNMLMINSHVAHDCVLGNDTTIANGAALAGHVKVEDRVVIGGLVGIHQYVRVGKLSMIGGVSKVVMDVAPFSINDGHPARFCGINAVGLRRAGFSSAQMGRIKTALKTLLGSRVNLSRVIPKVLKKFGDDPEVRYLVDFIENSKRGVARVSPPETGDED